MKLTPMLEQYFEIKRQVPDAILFFRMGDFYEMFFEDAEKAAPLLDLVLTARNKGGENESPMCGVPYHAADGYIARLIRHGLSVAICDQTEDPAMAKGLVKREVVRIVTPGTATESFIVERESCYLLALGVGSGGWGVGDKAATTGATSISTLSTSTPSTAAPSTTAATPSNTASPPTPHSPLPTPLGAAYLDVSTGDFFVTTYLASDDPRLADDIARFAPREAIYPKETLFRLEIPSTAVEPSLFEIAGAHDYLSRHFGTQSLRGFGLEGEDPRIGAAGAALRYAAASHKKPLDHVLSLRVDNEADFLQLDAATLANLEILDSRDATRPRASLWSVVNATRSAMGGRMLRKWITRPLKVRDAIFDRHDAVDELTRSRAILEPMSQCLSRIADLERLASRITLRSASPRECLALADSLLMAGDLRATMAPLQGPLLRRLRDALDPVPAVVDRIAATVADNPPLNLRDGGAIKPGVDADLDELHNIARDSKTILVQIEARERERTGIGSLKIRFNSVFGYYIEVSKSNLAKVPDDYIRKQTLVNAERFITPDLKVLEEKIVGAEGKAIIIETRIYEELLDAVSHASGAILATARAAGEVDALSSLATIAVRNRYVRATLSEAAEICIDDGRHPVIEVIAAERFIPNQTDIDRDRNGIQIITGPNMGGKSTYLRQVALIVLLNQIGSFVPASKARLGICDRIFTRVGASDQLARGESTFMVEMHETANILNNATDRSLIILDEVGRGTATFDGLSLAWAIIEYLHDNPSRSGITLFATHYHEVTDLAKTKARVANYSVAVKEWNEQIIFLRKVVEGAADKSYGIQVARLAGIPRTIIERAREILITLERKERDVVAETQRRTGMPVRQLGLFGGDPREQDVISALRSLDLDAMKPIDALNELARLKEKLN
jgi:DNA mismatch repair protein MutS